MTAGPSWCCGEPIPRLAAVDENVTGSSVFFEYKRFGSSLRLTFYWLSYVLNKVVF